MENKKSKGSRKLAYSLGIFGAISILLLAVAVIYKWEFVNSLGGYGYLGAFIISIFGGATILLPVPSLPVVFALGGVMKYPIFVGMASGAGETVGALTIYMTGYGGGTAFYNNESKRGKLQAAYLRLMNLMERKGSLTLFIASSILNPFFYPTALAAGAVRFGIQRYFLICLAGKTIKGITVAYLGYWGLRSLLRWLGMPL